MFTIIFDYPKTKNRKTPGFPDNGHQPLNDLVIRRATMSDGPFIYEFVGKLKGENFDAAIFGELYQTCIASDSNHYLVAETAARPVGYLSCHGQVLLHHLGIVYEIQEMFVDSEYRSMGVGKALLTTLEELLSKEDYKLLEVSSSSKRTDAHRFYTNNGFGKTTYKFSKLPGGRDKAGNKYS
jgi:(aminoalkyl)phosphonate N-acetyltransferase